MRAALKKEMELYGHIPGLEGARSLISGSNGPALAPAKASPADPRIAVLHKLNITRGLYENSTSIGPQSIPVFVTTAEGNVMLSEAKPPHVAAITAPAPTGISSEPLVTSSGDKAFPKLKPRIKSIERPVVVITRHGKTEYNKLGIFTGDYV